MKLASLMVGAGLFAATAVQAQLNTPQVQAPTSGPAQFAENRQLTESIVEVLNIVGSLRPGMTRGDVLKHFTTEGGISTRTQRTYVYEACPYIKITVEFSLAPGTENGVEELTNDTIVKISKPFLNWGISD